MDAEHTVLGNVTWQKVGGKMVCVGSAADPSFGQHQAIAGALLTPECEGRWANKASGCVFTHL